MTLLKRLFGNNCKKKEKTLAGIKRRAKIGVTITLVSSQLKANDMLLPDEIKGIARPIKSVQANGVSFDPSGPGGERRAQLIWPDEPQDKQGSLSLIASPHGTLAGFLDDDTFIVDDMIFYNTYRIAD
ncbi:hypothetical protein OKW43_007543 [Paraburkholderia sp. WC7.3g]|uniref:hypothetical protein n=1 Tax=Paraburkholderia sp. WC7.3g TaxID=2991070 RepID=UPI003D21C316